MITDKDIIKYFTCGNRIMKYRLYKLSEDSEIIIYIRNRYNDSNSLEESLYRIFHNIEEHGNCPYCGKPIKFIPDFKLGFEQTCGDKECIKKLRHDKSSFHNLETQLKVKETIKKKYGVENPYQIERVKEKAILKSKSKECIDKRIKTSIEKYGVDNPAKSKFVKDKISNILSIKSQEEWDIINEKKRKFCIEKYGVDWYSKLPEHKEKMSKVISSKEALNKRRKTNLERYGIENYNNQEKRNKTLIKNISYNKSLWEDTCFDLLKEKYPDVLRQYSSNLYKWKCDFYIPSLDLYIEFNGSQYHHDHPFNKNDIDDINELNRLKTLEEEKLKKYKRTQYTEIIYTWTDLDVRKRNIVKENNLNFIEFWSIDELKDWLNDK